MRSASSVIPLIAIMPQFLAADSKPIRSAPLLSGISMSTITMSGLKVDRNSIPLTDVDATSTIIPHPFIFDAIAPTIRRRAESGAPVGLWP